MTSLDGLLERAKFSTAREMLALVKEVESILDRERHQGKQGETTIEEGLVHMPSSGALVVVGDIHGDLESLAHVLKASNALEEIERREKTLLFLGDYGDRGAWSPEVYAVVLSLKIAHPKSVILLRGNHEGPRDIPFVPNDLPCQLRDRFHDQGHCVYIEMQELFEHIHHAAILDGKYLFVHGGVPSLAGSTEDVAKANLTHPLTIHLEEMLWNDPQEHMTGTTPSSRGAGKFFGADVTSRVLKLMNVKTLIRAHEPCQDGFSISHSGMILTLFSRKRPPYGNLNAAYLDMDLAGIALSACELSKSAIMF